MPEPEPLVAERQTDDTAPSCPPGPASVNAAKASTNSPHIRVTWSSPQSISAACTAEERDHFNNTLRLVGFDVWANTTPGKEHRWRLLNQAGDLPPYSRSYTLENFRDDKYTFRVDAVYSYTNSNGKSYTRWSGYHLPASRATTLTAVRTDQPPPAYGEVANDGSLPTRVPSRYIAWGRPDVYEPFGTQFQIQWNIPGHSISGPFCGFPRGDP